MKPLLNYPVEPSCDTAEQMVISIKIAKNQSMKVIEWLIKNRVTFSCMHNQNILIEEVKNQKPPAVFLDDDISIYSAKEEKIKAIIKTLFGQITGHISAKIPSVADIAADFKIDPIKFKAVFKNMYQMPFHQYFIKHKMDQARQLLESGDYSVKQISEMLGYTTSVKFVIVFKKYQNVTPGVLKTMARSRSKNIQE